MSILLIGISGGVLGFVLATAGIFYDQWQFWAVLALVYVTHFIWLIFRSTDQ